VILVRRPEPARPALPSRESRLAIVDEVAADDRGAVGDRAVTSKLMTRAQAGQIVKEARRDAIGVRSDASKSRACSSSRPTTRPLGWSLLGSLAGGLAMDERQRRSQRAVRRRHRRPPNQRVATTDADEIGKLLSRQARDRGAESATPPIRSAARRLAARNLETLFPSSTRDDRAAQGRQPTRSVAPERKSS